MPHASLRHPALAILLMAAAAPPAQAAGGHFDVDDATVVDPEHCQIETWWLRSPSESAHALHLGGACRAGPVEAGLNIDRSHIDGGTQTAIGPQIKWVADPLFQRLSAGIVWALSIDTKGDHGPAHTVYLPLTLWSGESVQLHLNGGIDWTAGARSTRRWGAAAEWAANDKVSVILEHSLIAGVQTSRLGSRFNLTPSLSLDLSIAHRSSAGSPGYAVGLNRDFDMH